MKLKIDQYMLSENLQSKCPSYLILILIGMSLWALCLLTPESSDDFVYKFLFSRNLSTGYPIDINNPVKNLNDIIESQYNHYFLWNGRTITHIIVQIFTGIFGKIIFNVVNAIIFVLFIYLLIKYVNIKYNALNLFSTAAIVFLLFPSFNETVLWMTGSINYLWTCTFVCGLLLGIKILYSRKWNPVYLIWILPSFLIGWTHEGITAPTSGSLLIYAIVKRKTINNPIIFAIIGSFLLGALFCSFSPATLNRANVSQFSLINYLIIKSQAVFVVLLKLRAFWILLGIIVINLWRFKERKITYLKKYYFENIIECNAILFSIGIIFLSGFWSKRSGIGVELFSIILILKYFCFDSKYICVLKYSIIISSIIIYAFVLKYSIQNYNSFRNLISQITGSENFIIVSENDIEIPSLIDSCVLRPHLPRIFKEDDIMNLAFCHFFSRDKFIVLPKIVYDNILKYRQDFIPLEIQKKFPFYVIPIKRGEENKHPVFVLRPTLDSEIPFYLKPFSARLQRYYSLKIEPSIDYYSTLQIAGESFIFLQKNSMVDNRVIEIIME